MSCVRTWVAAGVLAFLGSACAIQASPPAPTPCDQACQDGMALRVLRYGMSQAYNGVFSRGAPIPSGPVDVPLPCTSGTVHVFGSAISDPVQAVTKASLTYDAFECAVDNTEGSPDGNWHMVITGSVLEEGTISSQGTAVTGLVMRSDAVTFQGTVWDPAVEYDATCRVQAVQNGNNVSGRICERAAWTTAP